MRIEDCGEALSLLTREQEYVVVRYLQARGLLRGRVSALHAACVRARLCQADVVLALLRLDLLDVVERLCHITHCPSLLARARSPRTVITGPRRGDDRIVSRVRQPQEQERGRRRLLGCRMYQRLAQARPGMTVETLLARGITRKDLRIALRRGYLEVAS